MASPVGSGGTFKILCDDKGSSIDIHISEKAGISADNLSLSTWEASFILANVLHKLQVPTLDLNETEHGPREERFPVLELGAGTGLVGISAALLWRAKVLLTDLLSIIPGLDVNISHNKQLLYRVNGFVSCAALDWNNPDCITPSSGSHHGLKCAARSSRWKANVILAADTIYSEEHPGLVSKTIVTWLAPGPHSRAILCYPLRLAYIDHIRKFWELMESAGLECCEEGRVKGSEEWNEVANTPYEWCVWAWKS